MSRSIRRAGAGIAPAAWRAAPISAKTSISWARRPRRRTCRAVSPACSTPRRRNASRFRRHVAYQAAALAEPLAVSLHAVARAGEITGQERHPVRRRADRASDHARRQARGLRRNHRRRHRRGAARLRQQARRGQDDRPFRRRRRAEGARGRKGPSMSRSRFRAPRPALPPRSPASGAAARSSRSAIFRAARSRCRPMR